MQDPLDGRFAKRPGYNNNGAAVKIEVNQYAVTQRKPDFKVFQYDVGSSVIRSLSWPHANLC